MLILLDLADTSRECYTIYLKIYLRLFRGQMDSEVFWMNVMVGGGIFGEFASPPGGLGVGSGRE
jgi:hypothetical protein